MAPKRYEHPELADVPLAKALAALSDPCRVAIVRQLLDAQSELACHEFKLTQSKGTVSHHFKTLREGGLILTKVSGTECLNSLRLDEFNERFPGLIDLVTSEE